jgi:hypothetical protein
VIELWAEVDGEMLVHQGDIVLGPVDSLERIDEGSETEFYTISGTIGSLGRFWPVVNGRVTIDYAVLPSCIPGEPEFVVDREDEMDDAFDFWEEETQYYFDFVKHTFPWNPPLGTDWIQVGCVADTCASNWVGKLGGPQRIYAQDCDQEPERLHEIGHAIGLFHEQSRQDRDDHVQVNTENIQAGKKKNFRLYTAPLHPNTDSDGRDVGPFNWESLMFYDSCLFSTHQEDCYTNCEYPTMSYPGTSEPYSCDDVWLDANGDLAKGDLYGVARIYSTSWYMSAAAAGDFEVLNWDHSQPAGEVKVGRFCEDGPLSHPNHDDILWVDPVTDRWWAYCDGGVTWDSEPPQVVLTHTETLWNDTIIGNFDGEVGPYNEVFDDILANNPANGGKWMIWEDGVVGAGSWDSWNSLSNDVGYLAVGRWCDNVEAADDVITASDGDWTVSCGAQTGWHVLGANNGSTTATAAFHDFDGNGWTDVLRNNPSTGELEISWADDNVIYPSMTIGMGPFVTLSPLQSEPPNTATVDQLLFGDFMDDGAGYDGTDILLPFDEKWYVAWSAVLESGDLSWASINSFEGYGEAPFYNMAPTSEDLLVGQFTAIGGGADEVMMKLDVL